MDKISVIVPVYNADNYLGNCIESLINQTYKELEIILINDGSTDESENIMNEYALKDQRVKVRHLKNEGVSNARNVGLDIATGKWISFVDSDDWADLNMLSFAMEKATESNADIVVWSYFKNYLHKEIPLSLIPGGNQTFTTDKDF